MPESPSNFFENPNANSIKKAEIVSKYFSAWARIMSSQSYVQQINYIDLYSGTGAYENGEKSTPILILEAALRDEKISKKLYTVFNDSKPAYIKKLEEEIKKIPGINTLRNYPVCNSSTIDVEAGEQINQIKLNSTFSFIDPFGYKGLTRTLIQSLLKDWGCDVVFFFNYNRINTGINNPNIVSHINNIFGIDEAEQMRKVVFKLDSAKRELYVLKTLQKSLEEFGAKYFLPFKFYFPKRKATSHYIIFVTKNEKGYEVMKEIMNKSKNRINFYLNCYEFNTHLQNQNQLFNDEEILLEQSIMRNFSKKEIPAGKIFDSFFNTLFVPKDIRSLLIKLESENKIIANPPLNCRRKNTFSIDVVVKFP